MIDYFGLVKSFHIELFNKTGDYRSDLFQKFIPSNPTAIIRDRLHREEVKETTEELMGGVKSSLLKELCDVLYVIFGTAVVYNLPIDEAFLRVHQNNIEKLDNCYIREDGKVVKAQHHPKVQLEDLCSHV